MYSKFGIQTLPSSKLILPSPPFGYRCIIFSLNHISINNAKHMSKFIGKFYEVDLQGTLLNKGKGFFRIKALVNVLKPVQLRFFTEHRLGEPIWISFKYERLLDIYFLCGCMGHRGAVCSEVKTRKFGPIDPRDAYGPLMKAEGDKSSKKSQELF